MDECRNITESFSLGKTDGLSIQFYNVFWPLIVKMLVENFKVAYERKEMFNSQRKGIITLMQKG